MSRYAKLYSYKIFPRSYIPLFNAYLLLIHVTETRRDFFAVPLLKPCRHEPSKIITVERRRHVN